MVIENEKRDIGEKGRSKERGGRKEHDFGPWREGDLLENPRELG